MKGDRKTWDPSTVQMAITWDYSDFDFVSGNVFILSLISVLLCFSPGKEFGGLHSVSGFQQGWAFPSPPRQDWLSLFGLMFPITANLHISLKLYFYEKPLFQRVKTIAHAFVFDNCVSCSCFFSYHSTYWESLFFLNKCHYIPADNFVSLMLKSYVSSSH
jgi:hypothetical protein